MTISLNSIRSEINMYKAKNSIDTYTIGKHITSSDGYKYTLNADYGKVDTRMKHAIPPNIMLKLGVFSGKYINNDIREFPVQWYTNALKYNKLSPHKGDINVNKYKIKSRMSLHDWKQRGWIYGPDKKGWFQWWCRYYIGRRLPYIDAIQIKRWLAYKRHWAQLKKQILLHNKYGDSSFRPKQRQSLLQWAWKQPDLI